MEVPSASFPPVDGLRPVALPPESLHPALWRASQVGRSAGRTLATGFAALDAELPGGGWPAGVLTELLLAQPGVGEWRLLAPALAALQQGQGGGALSLPRGVLLFEPPAQPGAWALSALGLELRQIVVIEGRPPAAPGRGRPALPGSDMLWALEQTLSSGQAGAVLAWLPARLRGDALRRLQLAAQAHPGPVFLFRELAARLKPSAAPLRLQLGADGPDTLRLQVLKRRGPPSAAPLQLALPPVLTAAQRARAGRPRAVVGAEPATATPAAGMPA